MKKKEDTASELVEILGNKREFNALPYIETAKVVSPLPNLVIRLRDIEYKKDKIKLNEALEKDYKRQMHIPMQSFMGSDSNGDSHTSGGYPSNTNIIFDDGLKVGDDLAVLQSKDKQTLYVLFRIKRW